MKLDRSHIVGLSLALAASTALAAGPARTPSTHAVKAGQQNPYTVTQITLDNSYFWDHDTFVRTTFDNRPDNAGRGNPTMSFLHQDGSWQSRLNFSSNWTQAGANAVMNWYRQGGGPPITVVRTGTPNANMTSFIDYAFRDGQVDMEFRYYGSMTGYNEVLRSGGYYGAGGFFGTVEDYRTGRFSAGMTTFRFENNQDTGNARLLYNFTNDGAESGAMRARLLYLDRNGQDGYNKIRFVYVANPNNRPVSPH